jgi:uncharacterized protein (TIGR03083 family)
MIYPLMSDLIDRLAAEGTLVAAAAEHAGWDAAIPHLDWTVRDVVVHLGGVHRWATDIIRTGAQTLDTEAQRAVGTGPPDDHLLDWFLAGHAALVSTLSDASADLDVPTFLRAVREQSPLVFWARRQAHETAIHRADVESAAGPITDVPGMFAIDGISEIAAGFGARRSYAIARQASLLLDEVDDLVSYRLVFGGERIELECHDLSDPPPSDATVRGTWSDLYYWLWNRPSAATVDGDTSVADLWHDTVRVRWS